VRLLASVAFVHRAVAFLSVFLFPLAPQTASAQPTAIILDGSKEGRVFEGIGALSAGASSRLLIDYPGPVRSQILDYLFKANYGAAFQHLKVEVGGDVNSTDGCESSPMHDRDDENYNRGYEWWLMKEARARHPRIPLDCLAWGAPAWIGSGRFYTQDCADYLAKFLAGAKRVHGLDIGYVGIWNETAYERDWIKLLRKTLDRSNLAHVKIVGADQVNTWKIVEEMKGDVELAKAVDIVGVHYAGCDNGTHKVWGRSTPAAIDCGKPLWASEDGPWRGDWIGAGLLAKTYNLNYIHGRMTKTIIWSLVTSYYDNLPLPGSGVIKANTPWSGHYEVQPALWATAHTTQFAPPGWKYLDGAGCGVLAGGGSYVTLKSPDSRDYSIIVETLDAQAKQQITFKIAGGLPGSALHVWRTDAQQQFIRQNDIAPAGGGFTVTLDPGCIYSLTTTTGQSKGSAAAPPRAPFPEKYREDFESYAAGVAPRYLTDQAGVFEVVRRSDGKGHSLRQVVPAKGIEWPFHLNPFPETFLGDLDWENYQVSADVLIEKAGFVSLFGRVGKVPQNQNPPKGYWLKVRDDGMWQLLAESKVLKDGQAAFGADKWHALRLRFRDNTIQVFIDDTEVAKVQDDTFRFGQAGFGCGWHAAQFDNFAVQVDEHPLNLARWKPAKASSEWVATGAAWAEDQSYAASCVTDGYPGITRWSGAKDKTASEWIEIDLGVKTTFNRTIVRQFEDRISQYKIQYWDGWQWLDAYSGQSMGTPARSDDFPPVTGSKMRLFITSVKGDLPPSIWEIEVYQIAGP